MHSSPDPVLRGVTHDGAFRVIVADTTHTTQGVVAAQGCDPHTARALAELTTATVLFREAMSPDLRVQMLLKGTGDTGVLVADSAPEGMTRGLVQRAQGATPAPFQVGPGSRLQLMRTLRTGQLAQGVVELVSERIADGVMLYMHRSEQINTMVGLGTHFEDGRLVHAGGYMVQALPEAQPGPLMVMSERLADFVAIDALVGDARFEPRWLLDELLYAMPYTLTGDSTVRYACWCSESRLLGALATLERNVIQEMVAEGTPLDIGCDYCGKRYQIAPSKLTGLLSPQ